MTKKPTPSRANKKLKEILRDKAFGAGASLRWDDPNIVYEDWDGVILDVDSPEMEVEVEDEDEDQDEDFEAEDYDDDEYDEDYDDDRHPLEFN